VNNHSNPYGFPIKILAVDDKRSNLIAMQAAFSGCGYEVIEAISGKEAIELVKDYDFACILLDVQMPFMDGFETAIKIRREPRSKTTPIIFVTAIHRTEEYEEFGYGAGAVEYLFKPINKYIIQSKVAVYVELYLKSAELKQKNILLQEALIKAEESQKLKEELSSRDEFLLMASHELKTPITPLTLQMQTFIQLFEKGQFDKVEPERILRMLKTSQGQVDRLARLINELVDVSRISTDKLEIHTEKVNLHHLLQKVISDFLEEIKLSGCEVNLKVETEVVGLWDAFRMEQVIINLLTNALKYSAGKTINISLSKIDFFTARFCIHDNGIGIGKKDHERIFKRFERAVSSKHYSGLGLGLYITEQSLLTDKGVL
jgi:signal transduction histidine kinase